jgi:hypothetical protein
MKQGTANNTFSGQKREPISRSVDVCAAADIGIQTTYITSRPLYDGRGYEAPKAGTDIHRSGSQGKR